MRPSSKHGTAAMASTGCRCLECYEVRKNLPHGTEGGFHNWGCRCEDCIDAHRTAEDDRRFRRGIRGAQPVVRLIQSRPYWFPLARCVTHRPANVSLARFLTWFNPPVAVNGAKERPSVYDRARPYCEACPVRAECLEWAIVNKERLGFLGGMTPMERDRLSRRRRRVAS